MHGGRRVVVAATAAVLLAGCAPAVIDGHPARAGSTSRPTSVAPQAVGAAFTDPTAVRRVTSDATADLIATNTYDYRTLAADLRTGTAHTTGTFRAQYRSAFTRVVAPEARKLGAVQHLQVDVIGIGSLTGSRATVLVAVQTRITQRGREPRVSPLTAAATLDEVGGTWLLSTLTVDGATAVSGTVGTSGLAAAASAAATGVRDVTSLRRAHFAADYARALSATTGSLHTDLVAKRATTLATLGRLHADLYGRVLGVAAVSAVGRTAVFLVTAQSYRTTAPDAPVRQTLKVTALEVGNRWLVGDLAEVGIS